MACTEIGRFTVEVGFDAGDCKRLVFAWRGASRASDGALEVPGQQLVDARPGSAASALGWPVEIHAYADRIEIRQDGRIVAEHARVLGRGRRPP
jgi:hypothetical protein